MDYLKPTTKEAIEKLAKDLKLPIDRFSQSWECEVADAERVEEFLLYYDNHGLNIQEKQALMRLIIESYNDYISQFGCNLKISTELSTILKSESKLFKDIINYWSCGNEDLEDCFAVTPLMRKIKTNR